MESSAVAEPARRPQPGDLPPVALAPAVVTLAPPGDGQFLGADPDHAGHPARDLIARQVLVRVDAADSGPFEVKGEPDRPGAVTAAVRRCWRGERSSRRVQAGPCRFQRLRDLLR